MPIVLLSIYLAVILLQPQEWLIPHHLVPPNFLDMVTIATLFIILISTLRGHLTWPGKLPHIWLCLGFYGAAMLSDVAQTNFQNLIETVSAVGKLTVTFVMMVLVCNSTRRIQIIINVFIFCTLLVSIHCFLQIYTGYGFGGIPPLFMQGYYRAQYFGILGDPNDTALLITFTIPLVFTIKMQNRMMTYLTCTLLVIPMLFAVYLTQSRGGYLALVVMVTTTLAQFLSRRKVILALILAMIISIGLVPSRLILSGISDQDRTDLWGAGTEVFKAHPLIGVGSRRIAEFTGKVPHNTFIHAYSELGVIGYFFFFSLLLVCIVGSWRIKKLKPDNDDDRQLILQARAMVPSLAGFCAAAYFLSRLYFMPYYMLIGLAAAVYVQASRDLTMKALNEACYIKQQKAWLFPTATVVSMFCIYLSIILINRIA